MTPPSVHVVRELDLSAIDAIGFDLDHTLAVYDDARVNALAFAETRELLAERGYPRSLMSDDYREAGETGVCRGLVVDTANACLVKADGEGRVRRAARSGRWLAPEEIRELYRASVPDLEGFHAIHSPFDLPTAFLFHRLAGADTDAARACADIRHDLDRAHTRGELKRRILAEVDSLVSPLATPASAFARLRETGKRLFVLTNSEAPYAIALLDHLFRGGSWRELFRVVVTSAGKPGFFAGAECRAEALDGEVVVGAGARDLETMVGVGGERILYVGDSVKADTRPAREFGWRTAHVVQELSEGIAVGPWGSPLWENEQPTWFSTLIAKHADIYAPRIDDLMQLAHNAFLRPAPHPLAP
jgi:5'-nucleotidase